jgi:hypothetical protein
MKKLVSIAILAGALFAATAAAQTQTNTTRAVVPWSDPSRPGLVRVSVISGTISVRTHTGRDVIIEGSGGGGVGRNRPPDRNAEGLTLISGSGSGFRAEETSNVITISSANWINAGGHFDIQVPVRTNLKLSSINGNVIAVDGVEGDIDVSNTNGDVRFSNVSGSVIAHAQNGNVTATVREVTANKPMSFSSFNGRVDVTLAPTTKANLKIRTDHGEAWTNFDIKVGPSTPTVMDSNRPGTFRISVERTINGTINGGGPDIELRTFNGSVYLRKAQ